MNYLAATKARYLNYILADFEAAAKSNSYCSPCYPFGAVKKMDDPGDKKADTDAIYRGAQAETLYLRFRPVQLAAIRAWGLVVATLRGSDDFGLWRSRDRLPQGTAAAWADRGLFGYFSVAMRAVNQRHSASPLKKAGPYFFQL